MHFQTKREVIGEFVVPGTVNWLIQTDTVNYVANSLSGGFGGINNFQMGI
jgi:hypothetical protein